MRRIRFSKLYKSSVTTKNLFKCLCIIHSNYFIFLHVVFLFLIVGSFNVMYKFVELIFSYVGCFISFLK